MKESESADNSVQWEWGKYLGCSIYYIPYETVLSISYLQTGVWILFVVQSSIVISPHAWVHILVWRNISFSDR